MNDKMTYYPLPLPCGSLITGRFVERPNRFLLICDTADYGTIRAFLPNPGRLSELLFPGVPIYMIRNTDVRETRSTEFTVMAVERDRVPVMLHTHLCNEMAVVLIENGHVPGLENAHIVRREVSHGRSRFDFLLNDGKENLLLEVKSCTLFGNGVAMFPDAVTERGARHLRELANLSTGGHFSCHVLFIVQTPSARFFMPDYHTDPVFARTMAETRDHIAFTPLPVSWKNDLTFQPGAAPLPIPWDHILHENHDRGAYLLVLHLEKDAVVPIGALGSLPLQAGHYIYIGSAMGGLSSRIARHKRLLKRHHWHIDYLREVTDYVDAFPIRASDRIECLVVEDFQRNPFVPVPGFGCSDCACRTHLYRTPENPCAEPLFQQILQRWRMRSPVPKT